MTDDEHETLGKYQGPITDKYLAERRDLAERACRTYSTYYGEDFGPDMLALLDEVERLRGMLAGLVMSRDAMQGAEIMELSLSARRDEREKIAVWLESGHASYPVLDDGRRLTLGAEIQRRTCESCAAEIRNGKASEKP